MGSDAPTASTLIELYRRWLIALREQLGPVNSIRFLRLFDPNARNYLFHPSAPIPPKAQGRRGFKRAGHLDSEILRNAHGKHGISRRNSSDAFPSTASYVSHPWPSVFVRKGNTELVP